MKHISFPKSNCVKTDSIYSPYTLVDNRHRPKDSLSNNNKYAIVC